MQVDLEVEAFYWVPRQAITLTVSLVGKLFPHLPAAPFMHLLTQLNRVWLVREDAALRRQRKQHLSELGEMRRMATNATPYQQSVVQQRLKFLQGQLKNSSMLHATRKHWTVSFCACHFVTLTH
jgi:hypothetical protein